MDDIFDRPCILEYSEEQGAWHHNMGGNKICSNGYEPIAIGGLREMVELCSKIHKNEPEVRLLLSEAWCLVDKLAMEYDNIRMIILKY